MESKYKSKLPEMFKLDFDLGKLLNYPFQVLLVQALVTPFERLQVLKQCQPLFTDYTSLLRYKHKAAAHPDRSEVFKYPNLLKGFFSRD